MLVVQMNHRLDPAATPATVLGPFHIEGSPELGFGGDMSDGVPGTPLYLHGVGARPRRATRSPAAVLDVWQADTEGAYESQLPDVDEARLRAKYTTREDGSYCLRTIAPKGYTIPMDGPVGDLISRTEISHFRPGARPLPDQRARLRAADHPPVPGGRRVPGQRRRLRHQAGAGRPVRAARARATPDGGTSAEPWVEARYDFVLQRQA